MCSKNILLTNRNLKVKNLMFNFLLIFIVVFLIGANVQPAVSAESKTSSEEVKIKNPDNAPKESYKMQPESANKKAPGKVVILSYGLNKLSKISRVTIKVPKGQPVEKRAKKIQILTSEINSDEEFDWISAGIFELSSTEENINCIFDPINAQYIKIKILEGYSPDVTPELGRVSIGTDSFKLEGGAIDISAKLPIESVEIYLVGAGGTKKTFTDKTGSFSFDSCEYGTYEIKALSPGYLESSQSLPVFSGKRVNVTFKMKKHSYVLFGKTCDLETGKPIALAEINIYKVDNSGAKTLVKNIMSDETGSYNLNKIDSGRYELRVASEGYSNLTQQVDIESGKTYTINFKMKSNVENTPFEVKGFVPAYNDTVSTEIRVMFNHPVMASTLANDNFVFEYHEIDIDAAIMKKDPIETQKIIIDPDDKTKSSVLISIIMDKNFKKMPALDLNIFNVTDVNGQKLSEDGILVSNYK